jgi:translocation and assembly module TamA
MITNRPGWRLPRLLRSLVLGLVFCGAAWAGVPVTVQVEGVDGELRDNVLGYLGLEQNRTQEGLSDAQVALLHRRAREEIRDALEPFGHYRATVDASLDRQADGGWLARYRIDPGPRVRFATVEVVLQGEADDDPAFASLRAALPLEEGRPLRHADYDQARDALRRLATERGYFEARLTRRELRIDLEAYTADAYLTLDSGPRYRFGTVRFDQDVIDEALLRRYLPFAEGDPYHAGRLLELQNGLAGSNYFGEVRVVPRIQEAIDDAVPVDVVLTPRKSQRYTFSAGYGTDTGLRGRVKWDWRPANRRGHALAVGVELGEQRKIGLVRYAIPMWDPRNEQLDLTASLTEETSDTSFSRLKQLGAALQLGDARLRYILSLDLKNEESETGGEQIDADLIVPGISATYLRADNKLRVGSGFRIDADFHGGSETLGSDVSFGQFGLLGKHILTPWADLRLLARWELGTTWTDDFESLPVSERFYAGGDESIRGYDWRSLGPVNDAGLVVGGPHIAVGSVEVEHYFAGDWGAALFVDAGNAFDETFDKVYVGTGVGLRWRTPIGAIRVDVAHGLDDVAGGWRLHLMLGPDL